MKTAVLNEVSEGIIYNARLQPLAKQYSLTPRACAACRDCSDSDFRSTSAKNLLARNHAASHP